MYTYIYIYIYYVYRERERGRERDANTGIVNTRAWRRVETAARRSIASRDLKSCLQTVAGALPVNQQGNFHSEPTGLGRT